MNINPLCRNCKRPHRSVGPWKGSLSCECPLPDFGGILQAVHVRKKREKESPYYCIVGQAYKRGQSPTPEEFDVCETHQPHWHCGCGNPMPLDANQCLGDWGCAAYDTQKKGRVDQEKSRNLSIHFQLS